MNVCSINWGSVADWAAAFGSIFAVIVALYLSQQGQRVKLSVSCGIRQIIENRQVGPKMATIQVTNTGERPFKISAISLRHGLFRKSHGIIKMGMQTPYCEAILKILNDGDSSFYGFPLHENNWVSTMADEFKGRLDLYTFRITLHCSNGQKKSIKPEKPLLEHIALQMKAKRVPQKEQPASD